MEPLIIIAIVAATIMSIVGIIGAIVPAIPGPPLNYAALLIAKYIAPEEVSWTLLIVTGVIMLFVSVVDYFAPGWFTKWGGGSKRAITGSLIGTFAGIFLAPPFGLILGPFVGAFLGELSANASMGKALKVAFYTFASFILTTGIKLITSAVLFYYTAYAICTHLF